MEQPHDDVLSRVEHVLEVSLNRRSVVCGVYGAIEEFRTSTGTWVRIERRRR